MKAIILVAGYATRLYPLTLNMPKALLTINGKPTIDYIIDGINMVDDIDFIYVVSNHKFIENFRQWGQTVSSRTPIKVIDDFTETEETRRGAIGDIYYTICQEKIDDDIAVIAGDNFFTFDFKKYYSFYKAHNCDCVCAKRIDDIESLKNFAVAVIDESGKIIRLDEKPEMPQSDLAVFASYFYKRDTLPLFEKYLQEGNKPDAPGYFVQWLYKIKDVYAYSMDGECFDIGTPENYMEVRRLFEKQ